MYLYTYTRMTCFIESRNIGEIILIGDPVEHQTPLARGRRGILKEVV